MASLHPTTVEDHKTVASDVEYENGRVIYSGKRRGVLWPQIRAVLSTDLMAIAIGMTFGFTGVALPQIRNDPGINATADEQTWIVSSASICAPLGSLLGAVSSERLGRIRTMKVSALPVVIGWLLTAFAQNVYAIYAGRVFTGFFTGYGAGAMQVYLSEAPESHLKGMSGSTSSLGVAFGTFLVYVLGIIFDWRYASGICGVIPLMLFISMFFLPESPSYLVSVMKNDEAAVALRRLRGKYFDIEPEFQDILRKKPQGPKRTHLETLSRIFSPPVLKPFCISFLLFFVQQFSGAYVVIFYSVDVFMQASPDGMDYNAATLITGGLRLIATFCTTLILKRSGVRPLVLMSGTGMAVTLCTLATYVYVDEARIAAGEASIGMPWISVGSIIAFMIIFTPGFGSAPWFLIGELFPLDVRGPMGCIMSSIGYALIFVSVQTYPYLLNSMGVAGTFWFYGGVSLIGTIICFMILPETRGRTLQEIQDYFEGNSTRKNKKRINNKEQEELKSINNYKMDH